MGDFIILPEWEPEEEEAPRVPSNPTGRLMARNDDGETTVIKGYRDEAYHYMYQLLGELEFHNWLLHERITHTNGNEYIWREEIG